MRAASLLPSPYCSKNANKAGQENLCELVDLYKRIITLVLILDLDPLPLYHLTSCPKALNGQRFPCPAQLVLAMNYFLVFLDGRSTVALIKQELL